MLPPAPTLRFDSTSEKTMVPPVAAVQSWAVTVCVVPLARVVVAFSEMTRDVGDCANDERLHSASKNRHARQVVLFTSFPFGVCRFLQSVKYFPNRHRLVTQGTWQAHRTLDAFSNNHVVT